MLADLHTHTTASDGSLSPDELIRTAIKAGVSMLSITDHDTVSAYQTLREFVDDNLQLIPGIEFSSLWRSIGVHVVGLNIDLDSDTIKEAVNRQQNARNKRAEMIAEKLSKQGYKNVLEGAKRLAGEATIGRPHFARYLFTSGQIKSETQAFKKYLGQGKSCDIRAIWPETEQVISWIRDSGGTAVLAHPAKYKLTNMKLEELARDFLDAGGQAIEVISGQQAPALTDRLCRLSTRLGLQVSCGSDFHRPGQAWACVGSIDPLPATVQPVWESW
jgi:hypothetical protein